MVQHIKGKHRSLKPFFFGLVAIIASFFLGGGVPWGRGFTNVIPSANADTPPPPQANCSSGGEGSCGCGNADVSSAMDSGAFGGSPGAPEGEGEGEGEGY